MLLDFPQLAVGSKSGIHPCFMEDTPGLGLGLTIAPLFYFPLSPIAFVENRFSNPFTICKIPSYRICSSHRNTYQLQSEFRLSPFFDDQKLA